MKPRRSSFFRPINVIRWTFLLQTLAPSASTVSGLMLKMYDEFRRPDSASPLAIQGLTMEMFAAVSRNHSNRSVRRRQRWLACAEEFLRESFTDHLTLAQVASAAGVHPVYLAREFRRF